MVREYIFGEYEESWGLERTGQVEGRGEIDSTSSCESTLYSSARAEACRTLLRHKEMEAETQREVVSIQDGNHISENCQISSMGL